MRGCDSIGCGRDCEPHEDKSNQYQAGVPEIRIGCQRGFESCCCCRRAAAARRAYQPVTTGNGGVREATMEVRERSDPLVASSTAERSDRTDLMLRLIFCFAD